MSAKGASRKAVRHEGRLRRKKRVRKKVFGTIERPRFNVFRSARHIYAQVIDDEKGITLVAASTLDSEAKGAQVAKVDEAKLVGELIARRCGERGIGAVVFDRNGYRYHGRVQAVAEAARAAGLSF